MNLQNQTIINTAGNLVYLTAIWLLTVVTTHTLDYESVGRLTLAMAVGNVVLTIQMYGVRSYQSSDVKYQYSSNEYLYARILTVACGWIFGGCVCLFLGYPVSTSLAIAFFSLIKTSESFSDVFFGNDQRVGHLELAGYSMTIRGIVLILLYYAGIASFHSLNVALAFAAAGVLAISILIDLPIHNRTIQDRNVKQISGVLKIIKNCFPLFIASLIPAVITAFPRMVLERYYGAEELGYYGNVSTPALILTTVIPTVLTALLPEYGNSIKAGNRKKMIKLWTGSLLGTILITIICLITVKLFGYQIMSFVYTDGIIPYVHYLYYVLVAMMFFAVTMCCNTLIIPLRKNWELMMTVLVALSVCLVFSVPMIRRWEIGGAIGILLMSYGTQAIIQIIWIILIYHRGFKEAKNL